MKEQNIQLDGSTILVTGAAGFIGSNLVKKFFVKCSQCILLALTI